MEEKDKNKGAKELAFTPEQEARIREIVDEQIVKREKQQLHELRFGVRYPQMEAK